MAVIYHDEDANLEDARDRTVGILGYASHPVRFAPERFTPGRAEQERHSHTAAGRLGDVQGQLVVPLHELLNMLTPPITEPSVLPLIVTSR